jgi:hypothetical protein
MIGSTIMLNPVDPANRTCASGNPEVRLFFDPQNTTAISSDGLRPGQKVWSSASPLTGTNLACREIRVFQLWKVLPVGSSSPL